MISKILDLLLPKTCFGCGKENIYACQDCLSLISICSTPSVLPPNSSLAGLFCATSYEDTLIKRLLQSYKYPPCNRNLTKPLAFLIVSHFAMLNNLISPPNAICPVPLHKKRLKWRGFNHAEELASLLAATWEIPFFPHALYKIKNTPPQAKLNREQRLKNIEGAFTAAGDPALIGKTLFLVDDVYTTGGTMEECCRVLKKAGAKKVFGVTVARD
jgi:ComF family protein